MKGVCLFVLLLSLYITATLATRCITTNGVECCGFVVGTFPSTYLITETFAEQLGYFEQEGIKVCFSRVSGSANLYENLLSGGQIDVACSQVDNAVWRRQSKGEGFSVVAGQDGQRGFYLVGNTKNLNGFNNPAALSGKNIVVDSVDSGYVVGLRKVLADYNVENVTYVQFGTGRLPLVQAGVYNGVSIDATMINDISPQITPYPVVALAQQFEHMCPTQGGGYIATTGWMSNQTNRDDLRKFLRALIRAYQYTVNPTNRPAVDAYFRNRYNTSDANIIEYFFNDHYKNPGAGMNPFLTPKKAGFRNLVNTRIQLGMSPYPSEGIESFITNKAGGLVDLGPLILAQSDLGISNDYDTNQGLYGCPTGNKGTYVTVPPQLTCTAYFQIDTQPPQWPNGISASLNVYVSNSSMLTINNVPGWKISFTAKGSGSTPAFRINNSWNNGGVTSTTSNGRTTYTITNTNYNAQSPSNIGFNAETTLASPGNNICGISINGVTCAVSSPSTASVAC